MKTTKILNKTIFCLSLILLFNPLKIKAKEQHCGSDELLEQLMQDSNFAEEIRQNKSQFGFEEGKRKMLGVPDNCTNPIILPIAVHYAGAITNANPECLRDAALKQIEVLNQDYSSTNKDVANYNRWG